MKSSQVSLASVDENNQVVAEMGEKSEGYNQWDTQLECILSSCDNIYIPQPRPQLFWAGDSIQLRLVGLTSVQVNQFLQKTKERGVNIGILGHSNNARYFRNEHDSFDEQTELTQTEQIISRTCDLRLFLDFSVGDINLIGYIIKEELYKIISQKKTDDFRVPVTDEFEDASEIMSLYDMWASHYDEDHHQNGWKVLLNYVAYTLFSYVSPEHKILDIGCGTGLFGRELHAYNFNNLQGLDISQASLEISHTYNIYQALHKMAVGSNMTFEDNSFDALVSTGVFTRQQVPLNALDELIRILKPGGTLALVLRIEDNGFYYKPLQEYCAQNVLSEQLSVSISVQQTSNHELVVLQKQ